MQEDDRDALAGPDAREQCALGGQCDSVSGGASVHDEIVASKTPRYIGVPP